MNLSQALIVEDDRQKTRGFNYTLTTARSQLRDPASFELKVFQPATHPRLTLIINDLALNFDDSDVVGSALCASASDLSFATGHFDEATNLCGFSASVRLPKPYDAGSPSDCMFAAVA